MVGAPSKYDRSDDAECLADRLEVFGQTLANIALFIDGTIAPAVPANVISNQIDRF